MSDTPRRSLISRFFNGIWSTIVWAWRLMVIALVVFTLIGLFAGRKGPAVTVEDNIALVIAPTGALVEQKDQDPTQRLAEEFNGRPPSQTVLYDVIEALDRAAKDKRIPLAVLKLDELNGAGLAQIEEINAAIKRFQASGKPVYAFGEHFEQGAYLLAAQATEVSLDPLGMVAVDGISHFDNFFKEGLDKLGVTVNVFRVGEYKSAVEPFLRNDMSPEAKLANQAWMGDLWARYGVLVGEGRKLPATTVHSYVDGMAAGMTQLHGDAAGYAKANKLVTHVETLHDFRSRIAKVVNWDDDSGSFRQIHFSEYLAATTPLSKPAENSAKVAVVNVEGEIVDGDGQPGQAGGRTVAGLLDDAERDDDVQAVVLRVNSPGGSVFASEQIRRAVQSLRAAGKPVVASMSSVAASGGYWVSMSANQIVAHESTITGSIGIFGLIPTFEGPLSKLGIHSDGVGTTKLAGGMQLDRPLSDDAKIIIQTSIEKGYRDFIEGVAQGRNLKPEAVDSIARGRVWSGLKAKELGLVDAFGGRDYAIKTAAKLAKLKEGEYSTEDLLPDAESPVQALMRLFGSAQLRLSSHSALDLLLGQLRESRQLRDLTGWMNDPRGMYARCNCTLQLGF